MKILALALLGAGILYFQWPGPPAFTPLLKPLHPREILFEKTNPKLVIKKIGELATGEYHYDVLSILTEAPKVYRILGRRDAHHGYLYLLQKEDSFYQEATHFLMFFYQSKSPEEFPYQLPELTPPSNHQSLQLPGLEYPLKASLMGITDVNTQREQKFTSTDQNGFLLETYPTVKFAFETLEGEYYLYSAQTPLPAFEYKNLKFSCSEKEIDLTLPEMEKIGTHPYYRDLWQKKDNPHSIYVSFNPARYLECVHSP